MVRFSCFQARIHTHKQKKIIQLPAEAMHKTLEDTSQNWVQKNLYHSEIENKQCLGEVVQTLNNGADCAIDSSPSERDYRLEEIESKYNSDYNIGAHKKAQIKKSQSLGSGLNWKERTSGGSHSEGEMEQRFSYDGSADGREMAIPDGINDHALGRSEQCQEPPVASESVVNSDLARNVSLFSLGDSQHSEKEVADKDDFYLFGADDTGDQTPRTPHIIVKSRSLPCIISPGRHSTSFLPCSRSSEDLNALYVGKKNMLRSDVGGQVQNLDRDYSFFNFEKGNGENPADGTCETCNYVGSANDWIIPISDGANIDKSKNEETAFHRWDEVPSKDLRLKRIEEWVIDLQHCSPLVEENNESALCIDHKLLKSDSLLEDHNAAKLEVKVNPGMEAAKRYISSLNASATAAQLTNLGLIVIPFLSPFVSLKALNLSGNSIVRISAGALPRGLHILNLSKNSISTIEGLRELTRLRVLDLSHNRILRIGHGLASCSSLKELYLAGNKISEVEGLHRLLKLNILDLRFNKISTTKCLGQLAANFNCLQVLSLEGNPAQKNVGDEQLKKYVQSLLPHLTYYNRQSIKVGTMKDIMADRSARLGSGGHQVDRGLRADLKTARKGTHGIISQKASSSSIHGQKNHTVVSQKPSRSRQGRLPPSGMRTTQGLQFPDFSSKLLSLKNDSSMRRSRSEGTLGAP